MDRDFLGFDEQDTEVDDRPEAQYERDANALLAQLKGIDGTEGTGNWDALWHGWRLDRATLELG